MAAVLGVRDFILEAFRTLPVRKLCLEVNEVNRERLGSGLEHLFRHEGTLNRHEWHRGELVDVSFYALFREDLTGSLWEPPIATTSAAHTGEHPTTTVQSIVEDVLGCQLSSLPPEANLLESGLLDSLDLLQIIHEISVLLDRDIPREVIAECTFASGLEALSMQVGLVEDVLAKDLANPTPCDGWTVRDVLAHIVAVTRKFSDFADEITDAPRTPTNDLLGADHVVAVRREAIRQRLSGRQRTWIERAISRSVRSMLLKLRASILLTSWPTPGT